LAPGSAAAVGRFRCFVIAPALTPSQTLSHQGPIKGEGFSSDGDRCR